jgi:hypothetical protein
VKQIRTGPHRRLEVDDWPIGSAVANDRGALAGPEKRLVDEPLREVSKLNLYHDRVDECDFRFEPGFEANDQSIAQCDRPIWFGGRDVDLFNLGGHNTVNNTTADRRSEDERRTCDQSDEAHIEPPKSTFEKITVQGATTRRVRVASSTQHDKIEHCKIHRSSEPENAARALPSAIARAVGTRFAYPNILKSRCKKG